MEYKQMEHKEMAMEHKEMEHKEIISAFKSRDIIFYPFFLSTPSNSSIATPPPQFNKHIKDYSKDNTFCLYGTVVMRLTRTLVEKLCDDMAMRRSSVRFRVEAP